MDFELQIGKLCEADICKEPAREFQADQFVVYHMRLNARAHLGCVWPGTLKGEDVHNHAMFNKRL